MKVATVTELPKLERRDSLRLVIVESPYAGEVELNVAYARAALRDCLGRGEAPIASHLLYTQPGVLDDLVPDERAAGITAGLAWRAAADAAVFYVDRGWSKGMLAAREVYEREGKPFEIRTLDPAHRALVERSRAATMLYTMRAIEAREKGEYEQAERLKAFAVKSAIEADQQMSAGGTWNVPATTVTNERAALNLAHEALTQARSVLYTVSCDTPEDLDKPQRAAVIARKVDLISGALRAITGLGIVEPEVGLLAAAWKALEAYRAIGMGPRGYTDVDRAAFAELTAVLGATDGPLPPAPRAAAAVV